MKRITPLNRGTKPMKRSTIKPKRRRKMDTTESLNLRDEYRAANQECEVTKFINMAKESSKTVMEFAAIRYWQNMTGVIVNHRPLQVDHLWGGSGGRLDLWSMLIVCEAAWHDWKTANFTAGLLLFLIVKHSKGEINADEFKQCSGYELAGWLSLDKTIAACPAWLDPFRVRLIEALEAIR